MGRDYRQIKKDPIIDLIRTEAQREGYVKGGGFKGTENEKRNIGMLAKDSGISDTTLRNWFGGKTKRPQSLSTRFVLEALGVSIRYYRSNGTQIRREGM